jgi:hypothetical protein
MLNFPPFFFSAEELEKSKQQLDTIFKKTKTQPSLYFLPLSDEEVPFCVCMVFKQKNVGDSEF